MTGLVDYISAPRGMNSRHEVHRIVGHVQGSLESCFPRPLLKDPAFGASITSALDLPTPAPRMVELLSFEDAKRRVDLVDEVMLLTIYMLSVLIALPLQVLFESDSSFGIQGV